MVEEYLEKLYQEFYEKKLSLEQECQRREVRLKNNKKFIHTLEESLDEDFETFSPRNVDEESHMKIESLKEEQKNIISGINEQKIEISNVDKKMEELETVLENFRMTQGYIDIPSNQGIDIAEANQEISFAGNQEEGSLSLKNISNNILPDFTNIYHKIEMCYKLFDVDITRCKLELSQIQKDTNEIIKKLQKNIKSNITK